MSRISALALALFLVCLLYFPVQAQDEGGFVVPVVSETYTVPVTIGDITSVFTVTIKGSNILTISTDAEDAEIGDIARVEPVATSTRTMTSTLTAQVDVPDFPAGEDGEVDVVEIDVHPYDETWKNTTVGVAIRNNTDEMVHSISVEAEAYDTDGNFLGVGNNVMVLSPRSIEPGQLAFGSVTFDGVEILAEDTIEFTLNTEDDSSVWREFPLAIEKWGRSARAGNSITGTFSNPNDDTISIRRITLICFDDERIPTDSWMNSGESRVEELAPGESAPFQIVSDCESYIITASGDD